MAYQDLREYLAALQSKGLLRWVDAEVDKDWELTCVVRQVFRSTPPEDRYALGFRNVKGHRVPVVVGVIGASRKVYGTALETEPTVDGVTGRWGRALERPLEPRLAGNGPCQEVILTRDSVDLTALPIPTWTPGQDPAPYITAPCMITKDPETGVRNVGVYRMQVKGKNRTGVLWDFPSQHGAVHYGKWEARGEPMPMAVAIGVDPTVLMSAAAKVPQGVDELAVAGGLRGEPLEVVKCRTVDLEVPATAEIVLEGVVRPHFRETEGPFGEYTGYMGGPYDLPVFEITCLTHRRNPIYQAFLSQMPPSESSLLRQIPEEANIYKHLVHYLKIPGIVDVHLPEAGGSYAILWIRMKPMYPGHVQQVLSASWTHYSGFAKWIVATDEDIDIRDPFAREWALSWRVEPAKDTFIVPNTGAILLDPSPAPPEVPLWQRRSSKMCIDATRKWAYPPVAYPLAEMMESVRRNWPKYGL